MGLSAWCERRLRLRDLLVFWTGSMVSQLLLAGLKPAVVPAALSVVASRVDASSAGVAGRYEKSDTKKAAAGNHPPRVKVGYVMGERRFCQARANAASALNLGLCPARTCARFRVRRRASTGPCRRPAPS